MILNKDVLTPIKHQTENLNFLLKMQIDRPKITDPDSPRSNIEEESLNDNTNSCLSDHNYNKKKQKQIAEGANNMKQY
jgi:hypothetical protein